MREPTPEERFERLVAVFAGRPGITLPRPDGGRGFGSNALKVGRSIFAMLTHGRLVVKLPRARVAELLAVGEGEPFDAGKGTPMKEWLVVVRAEDDTWRARAEEALTFVGGSSDG